MYIYKPQKRNFAPYRPNEEGTGKYNLSSHGARELSLVQRKPTISVARPLLRVLGHHEMPGDLIGRERSLAFQDGMDVHIARAELELRKAMALMTFDEVMGNSSLLQLTALSLPARATAVLWTTHAFLQKKYSKKNDPSLIHHRNRDARMLYRQLAGMDLSLWANQLVDQVRFNELPNSIYMPPGHPVPGTTYRCHAFRARRNFYYPVDQFFPLLFEEREQALIALLSDLGATKIVISPPSDELMRDGGQSPFAEMYEKVFEYPPATQPISESFDIKQHPWLGGEPTWQAVVNERLRRSALRAQFEFGLDVAGMLKTHVQAIGQLMAVMSSMELPSDSLATLTAQMLQPRRVKAEFSNF
ncbi:MAG: hypothetical protein HLUCCA11_10805 [Phormidesmis priestleyi Ana]|uniref:Uncharacterized protein n=1 Tax=Phormidesmis priestleyi Ana TaxID=1666911 RepID=A0A0P7YYT9_9CYAN|nr:MAG: hypothetical protein HLUCCA11_10805 [Phormidesmis priestleyi Ana]